MEKTICEYKDGCVLHHVLKNPNECKSKEFQLNCDTRDHFLADSNRYEFAKSGMKAVKM